jgi:Delta7-sterol 5-desaturase
VNPSLNPPLNHFEKFESYIPVDLLSVGGAGLAFAVVLFFVIFRYFLMVTPMWWLFYRWQPKPWQWRRIYPELATSREQIYEIKWSLLSGFVFAAVGVGLGLVWQLGWTQIYLRFDQYPLWYFPLSWILLLAIHDTYFYWTHRWLHQPKIYKRYHSVHHASLRPTPWASFSFHPVESLINAVAIPLIAMFLPLHPVILLMHLTLMTLTAITNHLGFEILPKWALRRGVANHFVSGVHHSQHHRYFTSNFGLFFSFWDHWAGTENKKFSTEIAGYEKGPTHAL